MGKAVTIKLELAVSIAAVRPGSSIVLATVIIVVKYRAKYRVKPKAYLLVGQLIVGI